MATAAPEAKTEPTSGVMWIVSVIDGLTQDPFIFGPYTKQEAKKVAAAAKRRDKRSAAEKEEHLFYVTCYPIAPSSAADICARHMTHPNERTAS